MVQKGTHTVRKAWYAGSWYTADTHALENSIAQAIKRVSDTHQNPVKDPRLALLPHAGHAYSGRGIAHCFVKIPDAIDRVVVLAPSHYVGLPSDMFTMAEVDAYETPLGQLEGFSLLEQYHPRRLDDNEAIKREHALEMVLPFIAYAQRKRKNSIRVATALISKVTSVESARLLASDIETALGADQLESGSAMVIASSDFTHYGRRFAYTPYGEGPEAAAHVKRDDLDIASKLANSELGPLLIPSVQRRNTICGLAPASVVSALALSLGLKGTVADYYTSLDVTGTDSSDFVAYCTILWR